MLMKTPTLWEYISHFNDVKRALITVLFCVLFSNVAVNAVTVGNDRDNSKFILRDEFTWLRNRDVKGIETARIRSEHYLIAAGYTIGDKITLFGKAGAANLELHRLEGETHFFSERFAYGAGISYEITNSQFKVDVTCQYFTFEPGNGKLTGAAAMTEHQTPHEVTIDWTEWQFSLKIARKLEPFTLYGGPKYSHVRCNQKRTWPSGNTEEETFKSEENLGLFTGISMDFNQKFSGFFEVRFIDETAYTMGFGYHF